MDPSGQSHLKTLLDNGAVDDSFCCRHFQPSVADAYCYYASLGHGRSVGALQEVALLEENQNLGSRMNFSYHHLVKATGKLWKQWELGSLEAYLLSPLFGPRPKLVRVSQAKQARALGSQAQVPITVNSTPTPALALDPPPAVAVAAAAATTAAIRDAEQQQGRGSLLAAEFQAASPAPSASSSNTTKGAAAAEEVNALLPSTRSRSACSRSFLSCDQATTCGGRRSGGS